MEMTQTERTQLIRDVADAVARRINNKKEVAQTADEEEWVTAKEAAEILHINVRYLRSIKNRFPHTKCGDKGQGSLRFLKKGLMINFINGGMKYGK